MTPEKNHTELLRTAFINAIMITTNLVYISMYYTLLQLNTIHTYYFYDIIKGKT